MKDTYGFVIAISGTNESSPIELPTLSAVRAIYSSVYVNGAMNDAVSAGNVVIRLVASTFQTDIYTGPMMSAAYGSTLSMYEPRDPISIGGRGKLLISAYDDDTVRSGYTGTVVVKLIIETNDRI